MSNYQKVVTKIAALLPQKLQGAFLHPAGIVKIKNIKK